MPLDVFEPFQSRAAGQEALASRTPGPSPPELNLASLLRMLWRGRWILLIVPAVIAAIGFGLASRLEPVYATSAKVWVAPPKFSEQAVAINVENFRTLLENNGLASDVLREFGLDRPPHNMTALGFVRDNLEVINIRGTNVLLINIQLSDRELSARVANGMAEHAVNLALRLGQEDSVSARDTIKAQVDEAGAGLKRAEAARDAFRQHAQIELLERDVDVLLQQRGDLRGLNLEIESVRARVAQAEVQLQLKPRVDTLTRTIDSDSAVTDVARGAGAPANGLPQVSRNQSVSPVYDAIDQQLTEARIELSGLERKRAQMMGQLKLNAPQLQQLNQLYARQSELARHNLEFELAEKAYLEVSGRFQQAQLLIVGRSAQIQILDRALPPDRPIWPRPFRSAVFAGTAAGFLAAAGILLAGYVRQNPPA